MARALGTGPQRPRDKGPERELRFLRTLGRGGFGSVYLAELRGRDDFVQQVAVKVLSAELSGRAGHAARQRDEARLLGRLNHDHIVTVFELTELGGRPAVIMEHVDGVDAGALLRRGPLPQRAALQVAAAVASALHAAWTCPSPTTGRPLAVVHRDIKPENVLLTRHGGVKVLDFGVARSDLRRERGPSREQFGTARFMAPEQWLRGEADHPVDIYALGVTLVELLTGGLLDRAPLQPESFADHVRRALSVVGEPDQTAASRAALHALLRDMLAFEPSARPPAEVVRERCLDLADQAPGEPLHKVARRLIPGLLEARRADHAHLPLPSDRTLTQAVLTAEPLPPEHQPGHEHSVPSTATPAGPFRRPGTATPTRTLVDGGAPRRGLLVFGGGLGLVGVVAFMGFIAATMSRLPEGPAPGSSTSGEVATPSSPPADLSPEGPRTDTEVALEPSPGPEAERILAPGLASGDAVQSEPLPSSSTRARLPEEASAPPTRSQPEREPEREREREPEGEPEPEPEQGSEPESEREPVSSPHLRSAAAQTPDPEVGTTTAPSAVEEAATSSQATTITRPLTLVSAAIGDPISVDGVSLGSSPQRTNLADGEHTIRFAFQDGRTPGRCVVKVAYGLRTIRWDDERQTCTYIH